MVMDNQTEVNALSYITKEKFENSELVSTATNAISDVRTYLFRKGRSNNKDITMLTCFYMLIKAQEFIDPFSITYNVITKKNALNISEDILYEFKENIDESMWNDLINLINKYSAEELALAALLLDFSYSGYHAGSDVTPDSIVKLVAAILKIQPDEKVADIGCGFGTFINYSYLSQPNAHYEGYEINVISSIVSRIRAELLSETIKIYLLDAFCLLDEGNVEQFDKIFSNYPFGMKIRNLGKGSKLLDSISAKYPNLSKATSSDWVFNMLLSKLLKEDGKAVGIMTNGSTWNTIDLPMRQYFVENGLIEAVIALPGKLFNSTTIPTTMIILSHNNKDVRLVDATNICEQGRRYNEFTDENIKAIVDALNNDSEYSKLIKVNELKDNEYTLNLTRYLDNEITFDNAVPFESVIKEITRGAPINAKQLDDIASDVPTSMQYLMLANIQDGTIDDKLPYLSHIDEKYEKYCLQNNDLILSKNGYPYKVAVVSIEGDRKILANGNLYIIRLDSSKVDPYYVKAFFESEKGIALLKSITVGATIPNIGVDKLKKLNIPVPSLGEQAFIVDKYKDTLDEIAVLKLKLQKATNRLHHIFDEESEG